MLDSYYNDVKRTHPDLYIASQDLLMKRVLDALRGAQRYDLEPVGQYQGESMVRSDSGDWVEWDSVLEAIKILQGGCGE